jgi:hypothetical protein
MRMRRATHAVVVTTAAFVACCTLALPAHASGKTSDAVAAKPAPGSSMSPGGWFLLDGEPGATFTQAVRIKNTNTHAVSAHIEAVDATTSDHTGVQLGRPGGAVASIGRWIVVSTPEITLQPDEERDVSFTVRVPAGTLPGQYLAGVNVYVPLANHSTPPAAPKNGVSLGMDLQFRRAIAVEIDIPGTRAPKMVVSGAGPKASSQGIVLGIHMANKGNAFAHGKGVVRIPDTNTDFSFDMDTFVPGTAIVFPMLWTKSVVPGKHQVEVDIDYEGGRRTTWNGVVTIDGSGKGALEAALRNVQAQPSSGGFNWLLLLAAVLLLAFVGGAIVMRRRARQPGGFKYQSI